MIQQAEIKKLFDFREVPIPKQLLEVKVPRSQITAALERTARHYLSILPVKDPIQSGDIVVVDMKSSDPEWNRTGQHINVGMGFFVPEIESMLIGMKQGEKGCVSVNHAKTEITVQKVFRRLIPQLKDEHILPLHIENVKTVAEYRQYIFEQILKLYKRRKQGALIGYVEKEVIKRSDFAIPEEMIESKCAAVLSDIQKRARMDKDEPSEQILVKEVSRRFHRKAETMAEAMRVLQEECKKEISLTLIARYYAQANGVHFNRETYCSKCREIAQQNNMSLEEVRYPYEDYLERAPRWYLEMNCLPDYYSDQFIIRETED